MHLELHTLFEDLEYILLISKKLILILMKHCRWLNIKNKTKEVIKRIIFFILWYCIIATSINSIYLPT